MDQIQIYLRSVLPCRNNEIEKLFNLFAHKEEPYLETVFVYGGPCTGKTVTIRTILDRLIVKHCVVNLVECYSSKILFETILNELLDHTLDPENPIPVAKCDIVMDFINYLQSELPKKVIGNFVIVLDNAQEFKNMSANLLGVFLKLRELCGLPVTVVFISEIMFENYFHFTVMPYKIFFPQYNLEEIVKVLALDEEKTKQYVVNHYKKEISFPADFYFNYLNMFLSVFYRTTRNLSELRHMSRINFLKYCEPIANESIKLEDSLALWRHISPVLKNSLEVVHLMLETQKTLHSKTTNKDFVVILELPFYAKYLLIAAYLASYNLTKEDKRLFMKFQGKRQKIKSKTKIQRKIVKQMNVQLGPTPFNFDRLLAIFYSILEQKVGFNNNLLVQVSSLVELKFLFTISDSSAIDSQKYKCNLNFDFIQEISRMVGINIKKYLYEF